MDSWFCVQTLRRNEFLAADAISRRGFEVFLPTIEVPASIRYRSPRKLAFFTGYLFVRFDPVDYLWRCIPRTFGVNRVLSSTPENPIRVPDDAINSLRATVDEEQRRQLHNQVINPIRPGCIVRVIGTDNPFSGNQGVCTWTTRRRAALLMAIMHREIEVTFGLHQLELTGDRS